MAKRQSPRDSSLSPGSMNVDSEDGVAVEDLKPAKRLKTADGSAAPSPAIAPADDEAEIDSDHKRLTPAIKTETEAEASVDADAPRHHDDIETMSSISEDTDGEVPYEALHHPEDEVNDQQVTHCAWDGCKSDDLKTMDRLVEHLHAEHVEGKQRRYTCEWIGCPRKGKSHASAYALKAHLRSHTREKPYVCYLPECDLAFARADALGKHMRSSHEIDLMRSFDPYPRGVPVGGKYGASNGNSNGVAAGSNGTSKSSSSKLKIIIKTPQSHAAGQDDSVDYGVNHALGFGGESGIDTSKLTAEHGFSARELSLPLEKLHALCRVQLKWTEDEGEKLRKECATWEEAYNQEWLERQVVLDDVIQSEKDWHERRKAVLAALAEEEKRNAANRAATAHDDKDDKDDKDDDEDSAGDEDNDNDNDGDVDGDGDGDGVDDDDDDGAGGGMDPDATVDGYSFADASTFSHAEVTVNGKA